MNHKKSQLETVITLDECKLFHYLIDNSIYIMSRKDQCHIYQLHACDDFYAELRLDQYGCGIQQIELFRNQENLLPYLDGIASELSSN